MIAVDTNILVYAHQEKSPFFAKASSVVAELAEGIVPWSIPWPCIHEFYAVVTNPRLFEDPTPTFAAMEQIFAWLESPSLVLVSELSSYPEVLRNVLNVGGNIMGGAVHDARIVALCLQAGITTLYSCDRDFNRYTRLLKIVNPLV